MNENECPADPDHAPHRWSRLPTVVSSYGPGRRTITSCNNCLAIRVKFEVHVKGTADELAVHEAIVEQAP